MILRFVSVSFLSSPAYAEAVPYVWSLVLSFFMVILSIASLYAARFNSQFEMSDLSSLRTMFDHYPAWGKRASWAQKNSFESFTLHAPAALLAILVVLSGLDLPPIATFVAVAHPILRAIYVIVYISNLAFLRSLTWALGLICSGTLYGLCLSVIT